MDKQYTVTVKGEGLDLTFTVGQQTLFELMGNLIQDATRDTSPPKRKRHTLSEAGRNAISRAAKKRWAQYRKDKSQ